MDRKTFDDYITRFNAEDPTAFEDYVAEDVHLLNGGLLLEGVEAMKAHYAKIWPDFTETIHIEDFVSSATNLAVRMWTHFEARHDAPAALFGPVKKGDCFDFRGVVMYRIGPDGKFSHIWVSYLSFTVTTATGEVTEIGLPH